MKKICIILMLVSPARVFAGLFISEVAPGTAGADWVEISYSSEKKESIDISKLFVTMYYGSNEALADEPVHLYSYDRPETPRDDRFAVVHLTDPLTPDETDASTGWISIDSPLARALLKKRVDDEVEAQLPGGPARFAVVAVEYGD